MSDERSPRLYDVDLDRFWTDDAASHGRWFSADKPQTPLAIRMPATCVYHELGLPMPPEAGAEIQDPYFVDRDLRHRYNDKAERLVGMRFLPEGDADPDATAAGHGENVGIYATRLLDDPLPWTRMRAAYRLLGLVRRYGAARWRPPAPGPSTPKRTSV